MAMIKGKAGLMTANRLTFAYSRAVIGVSAGLFSAGLFLADTSAVMAQDCNADVGVLMKKRMDLMEQLNGVAKANKGKLDPIAGCPKLKALTAVDKEIVAYFTKNKDWCSIPDDATANLTADLEKTSGVATQACSIAEKMKKAQEQQAAGGSALGEKAVKLPAGPL